MRYPKFLRDGGRIGLIAPSFGCTTEPYKSMFNSACVKMRSLNYRLQIGANCYSEAGVGISNTPVSCGRELMDFYMDERNDILISVGGGELMCEILPYIDFEAIAKANPKLFMGYSDNTNFTFLSTILADTAAIYGPCFTSFGSLPWHSYVEDTLELLHGRKLSFTGYEYFELEESESEDPLKAINDVEKSIITIHPKEAQSMRGRLLGGCMDCLSILVGTKYDKVAEFSSKYKEDGILWFMEAFGLGPMDIRRVLWSMENAGWFENVSGFIFGRPRRFKEEEFGLDGIQAITSVLGRLNVPILMDADIGHLPPHIPLISGAMAEIQLSSNKYRINMELS